MSENQVESSSSAEGKTNKEGWEKEVIEKIALAAVTEQRRARRWGVFFKGLLFFYLFSLLLIGLYPRFEKGLSDSSKSHTAVIDISGMIAENQDASASAIIEGLRNAVEDKGTKGIILHLNTPGGTPVQAAYVYDEIRRTKEKNPELPIYAVVSDICASGCYYIAAAADEIYVSQASIIGSIGVLMESFGFVDMMDKLGVERRLLIAGSHKAILDPFSPANVEEMKHMQTLLDQVHQQFIEAVRQGRGDRLKETQDMFSGLVWTGADSLKLGLADGLGNDDYVAREIIGEKNLVNFTYQERLFDRLAGKLGASFGQAIGSYLHSWSLR